MTMSAAAEYDLRRIFKRCVQCPPGAPQCPPSCPTGQICSLTPQSCEKCAYMACLTDPSPPPPMTSGPNVGAIAGGVAGGVAFVGIVVFLIWLFWIRHQRAQQDKELEEEWEHDEIAQQKHTTTQFSTMRQDAASTRTRGSLANSILSRASNFIQIAYIPGVTNRNGSARNSVHTPVPPVPAAYRQGQPQPKSPLSNEGDALFFGIDDLRGSTYSGASSVRDTRYTTNTNNRHTQYSITPSLARDSVASDVYWDNATTAPMPASSLHKVIPRMVSVKTSPPSSASSTPKIGSAPSTPPLEPASSSSDQIKQVPILVPGQGPSPNPSIRGKATQVDLSSTNTKTKNNNSTKKPQSRFPIRQLSSTKHAPIHPSPLASHKIDKDNFDNADPDTDTDTSEHARARDSLIQNIDFDTPPASSQPTDSPFFGAADLAPAAEAIGAASRTRVGGNGYGSLASNVGVGVSGGSKGGKGGSKGRSKGGSKDGFGELSAVIEEATRRASADTGARKEGDDAGDPFGDVHEI